MRIFLAANCAGYHFFLGILLGCDFSLRKSHHGRISYTLAFSWQVSSPSVVGIRPTARLCSSARQTGMQQNVCQRGVGHGDICRMGFWLMCVCRMVRVAFGHTIHGNIITMSSHLMDGCHPYINSKAVGSKDAVQQSAWPLTFGGTRGQKQSTFCIWG